MTQTAGYIGIISREERLHAAYAIPDDAATRRMAAECRRNATIACSKDGPPGETRPETIEPVKGFGAEDQKIIGTLSAGCAYGFTLNSVMVVVGCGLALIEMTGWKAFVIIASRRGQGCVTELEMMNGVTTLAEARSFMANHPAVRGMAMARMFGDALEEMRKAKGGA